MSLIAELKRRNVIKVSLAYLALIWVVIEVTTTVAPVLNLPEWLPRVVVWVCLLGLPFVVVFSWLYELTPEGLKRDNAQPGSAVAPGPSARRLDALIVILIVLAIGLFAFDRFRAPGEQVTPGRADNSAAAVAPDVRPAIAVLPFADMSPDKDQEYMSDGIAEEVLNLLAKIPELRVISRSSAFSFKGKDADIPTVAQQLHVGYVLEGSVRKSGDRLRITAQLIDSGTDTHLWSETYDRELRDVFAVQDEIAGAVVTALKISLLGESPRSQVVDEQAYTLALQARYYWNRRIEGDLQRALDLYQRALAISPGYSEAWSGVSAAYAVQALNREIPYAEGLQQARLAAEKALELDPGSPDAHVRMGQALYRAGQQEAAVSEYQKALELDPSNSLATGVLALHLRNVGHLDEAISLFHKVLESDPLWVVGVGNLAALLSQAGRLAEAEAALIRLQEISPGSDLREDFALIRYQQGRLDEAAELLESIGKDGPHRILLAVVYYALGRQPEADAELASLRENPRVGDMDLARVYAGRGEADLAFQHLERAAQKLGGRYGRITADPLLRLLQNDPRYEALLERIRQMPPSDITHGN